MILTRRKLETILDFERMKIHTELKGEIVSRVYDLMTEIHKLKECNRELNGKLEKLEEVIRNDRKTD